MQHSSSLIICEQIRSPIHIVLFWRSVAAVTSRWRRQLTSSPLPIHRVGVRGRGGLREASCSFPPESWPCSTSWTCRVAPVWAEVELFHPRHPQSQSWGSRAPSEKTRKSSAPTPSSNGSVTFAVDVTQHVLECNKKKKQNKTNFCVFDSVMLSSFYE